MQAPSVEAPRESESGSTALPGLSVAGSDAAALVPVAAPGTPRLSIVVPGLNEAESLPELAKRIHAALVGQAYEIIFVDDGSTDRSWEVITGLAKESPIVHGVRLRKNFGKATALSAGFRRCKGSVIVTMDADLQDDPEDLPKFLEQIDLGKDVVVGWKVTRLDPANRLVLSRIFNATVRFTTGVALHDMNCGFKAYRREVIDTIPVYGDLFRYIPALAASQGFGVIEVPIKHHARRFGHSRYGLERILRGFFDLLSVLFLTRYLKRPMHLFGLGGLVLASLGFLIELYLTVLWFLGHKIGDRPLLLLGAMLMMIGIQLFSMGFIAEVLTYFHQKRTLPEDIPVREETR